MRARLSLAVLFLLLIAVPAALATLPGNNGRIAFRRYFDPRQSWGAIFTIDADGSGEVQVDHPARGVADDQPDWSPDGSLIGFTRCAPNTPCALYAVEPDGSKLRRLSPPCRGKPPQIESKCEDAANVSFLPDGKHVVYTRSTGLVRRFRNWEQIQHSDIVVRDLNGRNPRVLIRSKPYAADYNSPQFSPDGSRLLYVRANSPLSSPPLKHAVFVAKADGSGSRRVTDWSLDGGDNPDWSPDGKLILFRSNSSENAPQSQIYVVAPDGSGLRPLTRFDIGTTVLSYSFSPDGTSITFAQTGVAGQPDIFVMNADGTNMRQLTRTKLWDSAPDWGPAS